MQKSSVLFLLLIIGISLIGVGQSLSPSQFATAFGRFFALSGFFLLCVSLIIGPLAAIWPMEYVQLIKPRRAVGIAAFVFVALHLFLAITFMFGGQILQALDFNLVAVPATLILLILTLTSSDFAIRSLGPVGWKRVQQFNYLAFIFSFVHFIQSATGLFKNGSLNLSELALVLLGVVVVILQIAGFMARKRRMAQITH